MLSGKKVIAGLLGRADAGRGRQAAGLEQGQGIGSDEAGEADLAGAASGETVVIWHLTAFQEVTS
jgi:hypothetical protein